MVVGNRFIITGLCAISIFILGSRYLYNKAPHSSDVTNLPRVSEPEQVQETQAPWKAFSTLSSKQSALQTAVIFSPDSRFLLVGYQNGSIEVWDVEKQILQRTWAIPHPVKIFAFSPDENQLAGASSGANDTSIYLWEWPSGKLLHELRGHATKRSAEYLYEDSDCYCTSNSLRYTTNGQLVSASSENGTINFWDPKSGQLVRSITIPLGNVTECVEDSSHEKLTSDVPEYEAIAVSSDQKYIASTHNCTFYPLEKYPDWDPEIAYDYRNEVCVNLWDGTTGNQTKTIATDIIDYARDAGTNELTFSPNGTYLAIGCAKALVCLINTHDWSAKMLDLSECRNRGLSLHERYSLIFSPQSDFVAATVNEDWIRTRAAILWDVTSGNIVQKWELGYQISFSPNGQLFAVCMLSAQVNSTHPSTIQLFKH